MRETINISQGWRFFVDSENVRFRQEIVDLPHTISITPENSSGGMNLQCKVMYERDLFVPREKREKKVLLRLDGAMGTAELFLNGEKIGVSYCGYIPIVVDITEQFIFGQVNTLCAAVDNRDNGQVPPGKTQDMLDFTYDGGLYRTASIILKPRLHFTEPLLSKTTAGGGIFVWSEKAGFEEAVVCVRAEIENETRSVQNFSLCCTLCHMDGRPVVSGGGEYSLCPGEVTTAALSMTVHRPKLWSPETPSLYKLVCEVLQDGERIDCVETVIGIRTFQFTYQQGLIWNGTPRRISGANYHPCYPYIGNAVPENLMRRDVKKLRKLGMKNIRSHYPLADAFLDECDRIGMTVIVSNPGWQWFQHGIFEQRVLENMRNIIRWQRNHPCIILWEPVPNESDVPMEFQKRLHELVHKEYPFADCYTASDHGPTDVSYRQYDPGMLEPGMTGYDATKRYGTKNDYPVWIREYNDAPDNWEDQGCAWRTPRKWGDTAMLKAVQRMLGQDPQCQTNHYLDVYQKRNICGYGIWPGIEYNRGYHINPCWGGLLDLFRLRKFTAEFMDSQQDSGESGYKLFIANWWTDISPDDVTVFSNAQKVRLFHDGILVEEREPEPIPVKHPPFVFRNVRKRNRTRDRSTLCVQALEDGIVVAQVAQRTPGTPAALKLEMDLEDIPFQSDAQDIVVVHCSVVDKDGTVVPRAADDHPILFTVSGDAEVIGDSSVGANPVFPKAGIASVLIRSGKKSKTWTLHAQMLWQGSNTRIRVSPDTLILSCVEKED